jgi:glycosyltransferase involved in cell wall biosynthesis
MVHNPVRVCFMIDNLAVAGTESQLLALIRGLDRSRVEPCLCLLDGTGETSRCLEPSDCPILRLGVRSLRAPSSLVKAWRLARFLRRQRIDLLQVHFPDSTYFGVPVARLAGVPCVVRTRRDLGYWMKPINRRLGRLYNRFTDATLVNCEACAQAVIAQEGARRDSVVVLPNGLDLERFAEVSPVDVGRNGRPQKVGMVANLRPVKAPDVFVRAAGILGRAHPNVSFQIAGTGDEQSVRQLARQSGVEDRLELRGRVDDVPSFLGSLDVAVLTSYSEGLSNALLEYMAAGRPIVATAVGGNVELIEDGTHALLVPPGDPQAVAEGIDRLLRDPALAARLGAAAQRRAAERYCWETAVRRHEAFYLNLVQAKQ